MQSSIDQAAATEALTFMQQQGECSSSKQQQWQLQQGECPDCLNILSEDDKECCICSRLFCRWCLNRDAVVGVPVLGIEKTVSAAF